MNGHRGLLGLIVAVALVLTGCSAGSLTATDARSTEASSSTSSGLTLTPSALPTTPSELSASPSASGSPGAVAQDLGVGAEVADPLSGAILPNAARTPGATNPDVTQATIASTICVSGWTSTVRPPSSYTTSLKVQQLATGYADGGDTATADYEEDHLISLELGGSPSSALNLWPEPYSAPDGARVKDQVENKLHSLVCSGALQLAAAQHAIASNWWTAYVMFVLGGASPVAAPVAPAPVPPSALAPAPAPPAAPAVPAGATAMCSDGSFSFAAHHQGACSHHGGVAVFYH